MGVMSKRRPSIDTNIGTRRKLPSELLAEARRSLAALDGALRRLDEEDDLSSLLTVALTVRLMIGSDGLIRQICSAIRKSDPSSRLSHPVVAIMAPVRRDSKATFAVGALPASPTMSGEQRLRITEVPAQVCLVVEEPDGKRTVYTWEKLLGEVAYKLGLIHSDDEIPTALDEIASYQLGELMAPDFMIRSLGVLASQAMHELLAAVDPRHQPQPALPSRRGLHIANVEVRGRI
jgi:hypothetical protein